MAGNTLELHQTLRSRCSSTPAYALPTLPSVSVPVSCASFQARGSISTLIVTFEKGPLGGEDWALPFVRPSCLVSVCHCAIVGGR